LSYDLNKSVAKSCKNDDVFREYKDDFLDAFYKNYVIDKPYEYGLYKYSKIINIIQ